MRRGHGFALSLPSWPGVVHSCLRSWATAAPLQDAWRRNWCSGGGAVANGGGVLASATFSASIGAHARTPFLAETP